jgi:hypothetical protein
MALPVQNTPVYTLEIPSTKEKFKFRPFLVKEEKALLIAQQSEDVAVMTDTLKGIIESCAKSKIDIDTLATFDIEYIFCQIRAKSVGETVDLMFYCDVCEDDPKAAVKLNIDITKIAVEFDANHNKKIPLFDDVGIIMKYPGIDMLTKLASLSDADGDFNSVIEVMAQSIDMIYSGDEIHHGKDTKLEEMVEFVNNLTSEQFMKMKDFFESMPKYQHRLEYKCPVCSRDHKKILSGISNFF